MINVNEQRQLRKFVSLESQRASKVFDALRDVNRCKLFRLFIKRSELNVSDAAAVLNVSIPLVSQHLKVLGNHGLLIRTKQGRQVFYKINDRDSLVKAVAKVITK